MKDSDRITVRLPKSIAEKVKIKKNYARYVRNLIVNDLLKEKK